MRNSALLKASVAGALILAYFLLLAAPGLTAGFSADDLVNIAYLHGYGRVPLGVMLAQALTFFGPEYRPVGGLCYRIMFALFGLEHPLPVRIAFFGLLLANLALAAAWYARLLRSLPSSLMAALCATLILSFHPALGQMYCDNGTIYDALCCFFLLVLLILYVRTRQDPRRDHGYFQGNRLLLIVVLYSFAVGSKEMAITLPAVLLLYEGIYHLDLHQLRSRLWPAVLLGAMTAVWAAIKIFVPNAMSANPRYVPKIQFAFIGKSYLYYYRVLLSNDGLSGGAIAGLLGLALLVAVVLRNRPMLFGLLFANVTLLPLCVLPTRLGYTWYIPFMGLALYGGSAISLLADRLSFIAPARLPVRATVFVVLLVGLYALYYRSAHSLPELYFAQQKPFLQLLRVAKKAAPTLPHGGRVLLESDSHSEVWWMPLFLFRLGYRDSTLWVERAVHLGDRYDAGDLSLYDMRIRWDGSEYHATLQPQASDSPVVFAVTPDVPDVLGMVRRGQTARIRLPKEFAHCSIDVAYRMPEDELMRGGVWLRWAELDAQGAGIVRPNIDAERGEYAIDRLRACGRPWVPARASFVTDP